MTHFDILQLVGSEIRALASPFYIYFCSSLFRNPLNHQSSTIHFEPYSFLFEAKFEDLNANW